MSETVELPFTNDDPFLPPREVREAAQPIIRLRFLDGQLGWLVTGYAAIRAILADRRFSSRPELAPKLMPTQGPPAPAPPGMFIGMDPPDHGRYRRQLVGQFTVRRMRQLEERVREIVDEHLDAIEQAGAPADLVSGLAQPVPARVICELLGVPYDDREHFEANARLLFHADVTPEEIARAVGDLTAYIGELVAAKRAQPTDDVLGGLVADSDLSEAELATIGFMLLAAGMDTTANMIGLGSFRLLREPELIRYASDPETVQNVVEELLRFLDIFRIGTARVALQDVEIEGVTVREGEAVLVALAAGNRDPERFAEPEGLDPLRRTTGHLSFGHGVHQCLGQQLARVEMRMAFLGLFQRFPDLRLAVEPDQVPTREDMVVYGVHALPVTW